MSKGKRKPTRRVKKQSYYPLSEVYEKIDRGEFLIRPNASNGAYDDFGWNTSEIINAYKELKPKHFYKTENSYEKPGFVIDYYKARIRGEHVYTHFYINDNLVKLIINSFKQDDAFTAEGNK